jgi:carbon monoxide dehydrogenase subunit G
MGRGAREITGIFISYGLPTNLITLAKLNLSSGTRETTSSIEKVYAFLCDFNNFKHLLPADKIDNFTCSSDKCSFDIRGITSISIAITDQELNRRIVYSSDGLAKFNFNLLVDFQGEPKDKGTVEVTMDATLNPFIKSFAEKPLGTLVNTIADRIASQVV